MPKSAATNGQVRIAIDQAILSRIDEIRPQYMDRTTFINFQLDQSIDKNTSSPLTIPPTPLHNQSKKSLEEGGFSKAVEAVSSKAVTSNACALPVEQKKAAQKPKDPWSYKKLNPDLIPNDLAHLKELIVDWWWVRKGTRSTRAWKAHEKKIRGWDSETQVKALTAAYMGQWADLYEPKPDLPKQGKWNQPEPEAKHPAYRDFTAERLERERQSQEIGF